MTYDEHDARHVGDCETGAMWLRPTFRKHDHGAILALAKQHPECRAFSNGTYSGPSVYKAGWVRVFIDLEADGKQRLIGFSCHRPDNDHTKLFFLAVDRNELRKGVATELLEDVKHRCFPPRIVTTLPPTAEAGLAFCAARGFTEVGRTPKGGIRLALEW